MSRKKVIKNESNNISFAKVAIIVFRVVSIIIILICLVVLYNWHLNNTQNEAIKDELGEFASLKDNGPVISTESSNSEGEGNDDSAPVQNTGELELAVDFNALKEKNSDTVAWVKVNNTNIDFPVVKASDNNYYLKRNFNKKSNGAGWIFADYRNNFEILDKNTIIYGHNRRNGTMFSNLEYLLKDSWNFENENKQFYFSTEQANYDAEIFSVYMIKASKLTIPNQFVDNAEFQNYIKSLKELSIHEFNVEITENDNIITLCTCDSTSKNRIVVHAKLIKK